MTDQTADLDSGQEAVSGSTRRTVLRGALVAGAALPILAACGGSSSGSNSSGSGTPTVGGGGGSTRAGGGSGNQGGGAANAIATTSDVPSGGGVIVQDAGVVITQPKAGEFKGFSSTCTHMGCPLDNVSGGTINCICHGSEFSISDGSVVRGPATSPLPAKQITVKGSDISLA